MAPFVRGLSSGVPREAASQEEGHATRGKRWRSLHIPSERAVHASCLSARQCSASDCRVRGQPDTRPMAGGRGAWLYPV